jgi:hypothetical protein
LLRRGKGFVVQGGFAPPKPPDPLCEAVPGGAEDNVLFAKAEQNAMSKKPRRCKLLLKVSLNFKSKRKRYKLK